MEEEEMMEDISETQYTLLEHVATEHEFDEVCKSWDESDKERKPDNQMNQQPANKQCHLWISWEEHDGSGVRGEQQVRGEEVRGEPEKNPQQGGGKLVSEQQQQVRGEPEKNPQQRGVEPDSEQQQKMGGEH